MKKVQPPVINALNVKQAYFVSRKNSIDFRQSLNIKNVVFDKTTEHTHFVQTFEQNKGITVSTFKLISVRQTPFSHQSPQKPLINSQEVLQNAIPRQIKVSMAVNSHQYDDVPEPQFHK
jgi:hypothetical protein